MHKPLHQYYHHHCPVNPNPFASITPGADHVCELEAERSGACHDLTRLCHSLAARPKQIGGWHPETALVQRPLGYRALIGLMIYFPN